MSSLKFFPLLLLSTMLFGQVVEEPAPASHLYHVAFPEKAFNGDWRFVLEGISLGEGSYQVNISDFDTQGRFQSGNNFEVVTQNQAFAWDIPVPTQRANRIQALVVETTAPVHMVLWMLSEDGQINGVEVRPVNGNQLYLTHIPESIFKWRTSFAVLGVGQPGVLGNVLFGYYGTNRHFSGLETIFENFQVGDYLRRTPHRDISIGELGSNTLASWGHIATDNTELKLAGFQTFARDDDSLQTAAIELAPSGKSSGGVLFTKLEDLKMIESYAFTNIHQRPVDLDLVTLAYVPRFEEGELVDFVPEEIHYRTRLQPFERRLLLQGQLTAVSPFENLEQNSVYGLRYKSTFVPESVVGEGQGSEDTPLPEPEPAEVLSLHLQSIAGSDVLGGHVFCEGGDVVQSWLTQHALFGTKLEVSTLGMESTEVEVTIFRQNGSFQSQFKLQLEPFKAYDALEISNLTGQDALPNETAAHQIFKVVVKRLSGSPIIGKLTAFTQRDLALVNPHISLLPPEPVEETDAGEAP